MLDSSAVQISRLRTTARPPYPVFRWPMVPGRLNTAMPTLIIEHMIPGGVRLVLLPRVSAGRQGDCRSRDDSGDCPGCGGAAAVYGVSHQAEEKEHAEPVQKGESPS
ncbi:hypothetical protein [Streptomyces sp. NPDC051546]|uniref:hypothetical protein n=1 Tax=Streptomyces sp. NPDC051546 TaxID=3365655 RepID=UPI0037947CCE